MTTLKTVVLGDTQLSASFKRAERELANLDQPLRSAASTVRSASQSKAPRVTGALASSMRTGEPGVIESPLIYANPIHWGWRDHGIEPQPWLSRAAQATEPVWITDFERYLDQVIDKVEGM